LRRREQRLLRSQRVGGLLEIAPRRGKPRLVVLVAGQEEHAQLRGGSGEIAARIRHRLEQPLALGGRLERLLLVDHLGDLREDGRRARARLGQQQLGRRKGVGREGHRLRLVLRGAEVAEQCLGRRPVALVVRIGEALRHAVELRGRGVELLPHGGAVGLALRISAQQVAAQGRERGIEIADHLGARDGDRRAQGYHAVDGGTDAVDGVECEQHRHGEHGADGAEAGDEPGGDIHSERKHGFPRACWLEEP
jgi:hypothetical protein